MNKHPYISISPSSKSASPTDDFMQSVDLATTSPVAAAMKLPFVADRGNQAVSKLQSIMVRQIAQREEANPR